MRPGTGSAARPVAPEPELLAAYLAARYEIDTGAGLLRLEIGARPAVPPPAPGCVHAVLTACNPGSVPLPVEENRARQARLQSELDALGLRWRPARNHAADGSWAEPACWIADIAPARLDDLAARFGQNASLTVATDGVCRLRIHRDDWLPHDRDDDRLQWPN